MAFNVQGNKKDNTKDNKKDNFNFNFNLKDSGWSITNVRVVTDHMVSFTLKMYGLSLYNMKVTESTRGNTAGQMFLRNGQSKGSDGVYYNNYALYLSEADKARIIEAVCAEVNND